MANIFDTFNRPNDPLSLGTADTGQVWTQVAAQGAGGVVGTPFGILSNQGYNNAALAGALGDSLIVADSGMNMTRGGVTIMNADAGTLENLRNQGVVIIYVDDTHYIFLTYARAGGGLFRLYIADGGTAIHRGPDCSVVMADGDTMGWEICGQTINALHNGISAENYPITFTSGGGFTMSDTLLMGTKQGLQAAPDLTTPVGSFPYFEDFHVESNDTCVTFDCSEAGCVLNEDGLGEFNSLLACEVSCGVTPTYNCIDGECCDPGDGSGEFATLALCQAACGVVSYNCVDGFCVDPGDGSGEFATLLECQESGCEPVTPPIETCPENEPPANTLPRVQRVLDFDQEIQRNLQLQISALAPLTLYGYSHEWIHISISELTNQRNAYGASFQFSEWGHFFQAYVAYISSEDITWNIIVDGGTADTYTLPNSNGAFVKQWVILQAKKGKLFDWSFSSTEEFQIIPSQSILLAKEFKTTGQYNTLQPFGDQT